MSVKKKKMILLDTRSWILRRNKRRMNITLVQELTFENGVELLSHVAQSCYSVIGDKPFLWSKPKFDPP